MTFRHRSASHLPALLIAAFALLFAGCDVDPGVDDVQYPCSSSRECGEGFDCKLDPSVGEQVCVPEGTAFDAGMDVTSDTSGDADCEGTDCLAPPEVITLNMDGPLDDSTVPPTVKTDGSGGLLVGGVFDTCLTLQTDVECAEATERKLLAEGFITKLDAFVLRLEPDGSVGALHQVTAGINGLIPGFDASLMLTDIAPLSTGDWIVGGTNWDDELTYNTTSVGAPDVPNGVSDEHHRWLLRSGDDTVDWNFRAGYAGHEYLGALDVNSNDVVASAGVFAERYYRHPQVSDGDSVESYSSESDSEELAVSGLVEVRNPDGTIHSSIRLQSGYDLFTGAVAISRTRQVALFGQFRSWMDVFYDAYDDGWTAFSDSETLNDYAAEDESQYQQFLLLHADEASQPAIREIGPPGSIDVFDARFEEGGDLVAVGRYGSNINFGGGDVSAGFGDTASFIARWSGDDLSFERLITFDSDEGRDGFTSLANGPRQGSLVVGGLEGSIDYGEQTVAAESGTDALVAEFAADGRLLWHEVISGPGRVYPFGATTLGDNRVAVLLEAENEVEYRGVTFGQVDVVTTHIVIFEPSTQ